MIKAVIFDFDGTLSSEREYIYGCFRFVAPEIERSFGVSDAAEKLICLFNESWNDTFGRLLRKEHIEYSQADMKSLVEAYRNAPPTVSLYDDTLETIKSFRKQGIKIAILTNGYYKVQKEKIGKSGLEPYLNAVEIPDLYGKEFWKPDVRRGEKLLEVLDVAPQETLYVGDSDSDYRLAEAMTLSMAYIKRKDRVNDFHFEMQVEYVIPSLEELRAIVGR